MTRRLSREQRKLRNAVRHGHEPGIRDNISQIFRRMEPAVACRIVSETLATQTPQSKKTRLGMDILTEIHTLAVQRQTLESTQP